MRGPQRDATSSSSGTTAPDWTALSWSQPGRALTVAASWRAADGVGQEDQVRVGLDDVLLRQLRVAAAVRVGLVGDVLEAEQRVHLADERLRRDREEGVVELVVVGQGRRPRRQSLDDGVDLRLHLPDQLRGLTDVAGGHTELLELLVHVVEGRRRGEREHGDVELPEAGRQAGGVVGDDHQVRLLGRDRLDVRLERREVRDRRVGRVVRVAVDRGHLRAGADGVEHLGRRRRERDDRPGLLVQRDAAVGRGDGDREGAGGGRRRRLCGGRGGRGGPGRGGFGAGRLGGAGRVAARAAAGHQDGGRHAGQHDGEGEAGGLRSHGSSSIDERRTKRARSAPGRRRTNHPSSEGSVRRCREGDRTRPPWEGASPLRDSAGITPDFATVAPLGRVRARATVAAGRTRCHHRPPRETRYGDRPCPGSS